MIHPVWSATSCDFPGAGLYIGLAPLLEQEVVSRLLTPKRMRVIAGATTRFGPSGAPVPLEYYAVRDPSVVRVIPVKRPPLPSGFRHVKLSFQLTGMRVSETAEELRRSPNAAALDATAGFVMTIGLPANEEEKFFERAVSVDPEQDFTDLCTRIRDMAKPGK